MKNIMKLTVITTLMVIGMATANAQTTFTNVVLKLNVSLTGFRQAEEDNAAPVRIGSKDIISATAGEGSKSAQLLVISPAEGGDPGFYIRTKTGTEIVDTPVEMNISTGEEVVGAKGVRYTILTLNFSNGEGTDFSVSGFATLRQGNASGKGIGTIPDQITSVVASVSGTGHVNGEFVVLKGSVSGSGAKVELIEIP